MTQKWIKAIRECGLTFIRKHTFGENMNVYESLHKWNNMVIGKYLILPVSFETFADISENANHFKQFEEEVVSPFYFSLKGDWSWNLYICFVLQNSDLLRVTTDRLSLVQRGKRFAKKIIISENQMSDKLPMARIPKLLSGATIVDPLQEWQEKLTDEGLLFCLDNFRQQPLREYLESDVNTIVPCMETPIANENTLQRPAGHIHSLQFGEQFRPHFLSSSPMLNFSQINLLEGPNGMGKTSVLECIELAYTGAIQRNLLADRNATESWNGRIIIGDNEVEFNEIPTESEKKIRETAYYKHKVGPRRSSQLNRAFHQYNYFSSESVHQFCFSSNSQIDYRSAFARVIFGEQLERYEQCLNQYNDEFQKSARRLGEEYRRVEAELEASIDEDITDNVVLQERVQAKLKSMVKWIKNVLPNYPTPEEPATLEEVEQWLQHIKPWLHDLDVISTPLANHQHRVVYNGKQLVQEENSVDTAYNSLQNQIANLRVQLGQLPLLKEIKENVEGHWLNFEKQHKRHNELEQLLQKIKDFAVILDNRGSLERRKQINNELISLEKSNRQLEDIWNLFGPLTDIELKFVNEIELRDQIVKWKEKRNQAHVKLAGIKESINNHKVHVNKLQVLLSELKSNALQYIHEHPNQSNCPLCGHNHETVELLRGAINTSLTADDGKLTAWLEEEEQIKEELNVSIIELDKLNKVVSILEQLKDARLNLINKHKVEETTILSDNSDFKDVQDVLKRIHVRMIKQNNYQKELRHQADTLDQQGITLSAIHELNMLIDSELFAKYLDDVTPEKTSIEILVFITEELVNTKKLVELARLEYISKREDSKQVNKSYQILTQKLDELLTDEQQLMQRKMYLSELRQAWVRLKEKNVHIPDDYNWIEWRQYFTKLFHASQDLDKSLEPRILLEKKSHEVSNLRNQLRELNFKLKRCHHAIQVLSEIRNLAQYGDDFVRSNFEAISQLFVALHSPNEFDRLEWTQDDKIVAKRKGSDRICALHQMSTGQRTSVILAVFFIMHLVMESAPQFLLLDEPVANMDELNVVGLLDFLRQLSITKGTQIFFTTANPQIATLFRRKFSILEDRFRSFHLRRDIEGPVKVHVQKYLPYQERPILIPFAH
ncbi:exonuclease SbcC [Neobacillus sp. B4I6]|uniref:AAA family ATPase n=1 Tax=Neobacillus sp. B4I6 TaxID=3373925 RepID=UPI003D1A400F